MTTSEQPIGFMAKRNKRFARRTGAGFASPTRHCLWLFPHLTSFYRGTGPFSNQYKSRIQNAAFILILLSMLMCLSALFQTTDKASATATATSEAVCFGICAFYTRAEHGRIFDEPFPIV